MSYRPTRSILLAGACAVAFALALPAQAQDMKPGLWSQSSTISSKDPQVQSAMSTLQQHMANLSPTQRAQMDQLMKQNGVQMDVGNGGALQTKICMTREMIARKEFPVQQGDCKQSYTQQGNVGHLSFVCTRPKVSGEGDVTMIGDSAYRARMHVNNEGSASQAVDVDMTAKWLSADCGALKPLGAK